MIATPLSKPAIFFNARFMAAARQEEEGRYETHLLRILSCLQRTIIER